LGRRGRKPRKKLIPISYSPINNNPVSLKGGGLEGKKKNRELNLTPHQHKLPFLYRNNLVSAKNSDIICVWSRILVVFSMLIAS
jgi:hypothetical protein